MYELTCPFCGHVRRSPFVRVHAVARCAGCRRSFQIEPQHVRRHMGVALSPQDDALERAAVDAGDSAAALRALSTDESVDEDPSSRSGAHELLNLPGHAAHAAESARRGLGVIALRIRTFSVIHWSAMAIALLGVVALVRFMPAGVWPRTGGADTTGPPLPQRPRLVEPASPSLVLGEAAPVAAAVWQPVAADFQPPPPSGAVRFEELGWRADAGGRSALQCILLRSDAMVRINSTLHVQVSAGVGRHRLMRSSLTIPVLMPDTPLALVLPAPAGMMGEPQPTVWLEAGPPLPDAVPLTIDDVRVETHRGMESLRLSAVNATQRYLRPTRFVATAWDVTDSVVGIWTLDYRPLIEPSARVELSAPVTLSGLPIARWEAIGVAMPAGGLSADIVDWGR
jgi:hypothetical protein